MKKVIIILFILFSQLIFAKDERKQYTVFIKPYAVLTSLHTYAIYQNPKGFYAKVVEVNSNLRDQFYVYDKNGKAQYTVEANDVVEIENDINLFTNETGDKFYPLQSQFRTTNKIFPLESELAFHLDSLDLSSLNEFLQSEVNTTSAPRYTFNTHYVSILPVNIGFNFNYQSASWIDQNLVDSRLSIIAMGPEFKIKLLTNETYKLGLMLSYEFSPLYEISSGQGKDKFSAYMWNLGVQNEFSTPIGLINLGVDFRKHYLTFKNSTREIQSISPNEYTVTSLGLSVGYKIDWEL